MLSNVNQNVNNNLNETNAIQNVNNNLIQGGTIQSNSTKTDEQIIKSIRDYNTAVENILDYFNENEEVFNDCIEELDSYNGYLGDDRYYYMDELDEIYNGTDPTEILRRAFYGYDEDNYITDQYGRKEYSSFNPNREFFRFNGYGNLVSADYKDYSAWLDEHAVKSMLENRRDIYTISDDPELEELFDALELAADEQ